MSMFLVEGFGVLDDSISIIVNGRSKPCPVFTAWKSMIIRCYVEKHRHKYQSYKGCTVSEEWRLLSNFKRWAEERDFEGKRLDKDLLSPGNRVYSPETCAMISQSLNAFVVRDGDPALLEGVIFDAKKGVYKPIRYTKWLADNDRPWLREKQSYREFDSEADAHVQWLKNKHEAAQTYVDFETDERVIETLKTRWRG